MTKIFTYSSILAPYIVGLIEQKRSNGFKYDSEAYSLKKFDGFCIQRNYSDTRISKELVDAWAVQRPSESSGYRSQRVSYVRQLSIFMNSLGIQSYIPRKFISKKTTIPHILSNEELESLFAVIDSYCPTDRFRRLALEYKILYRLLYCCGLRISEGCNLKRKDIDFIRGTICLLHAKGDKDRLIYLPEDLLLLCKQYWELILRLIPEKTVWFFPSMKTTIPLPKTSIDRKFQQFWVMTLYASGCDKRPTVHSLRHTFVINRMNTWMLEGRNLNNMMPYLSAHLGHASPKETFYYFHQIERAFQIVREKDTSSRIVIPEVMPYEE